MPTLKEAPWPDEESSAIFKTYANYMIAWGVVLTDCYGSGAKNLLSTIESNPRYGQLKTTSVDATEIRRHLRASWNNEAAMSSLLQSADGDAIRYANVWVPVQAYYAAFASCRATLTAFGTSSTSHLSVLRSMSALFKSQAWLGSPWTANCSGCPSEGTQSYTGVPSSAKLGVSNLTVPTDVDTAWGLVALSLKRARARMLEEAFEQWRREKKKSKMPKVEKVNIGANKHATTFFDYLYRMRIRSNYRDTDAFVQGAWLDFDAKSFYKSAVNLAWFALRINEILVRGRLGAPRFASIVNEFMKLPRNQKLPVSVYWQPRL